MIAEHNNYVGWDVTKLSYDVKVSNIQAGLHVPTTIPNGDDDDEEASISRASATCLCLCKVTCV